MTAANRKRNPGSMARGNLAKVLADGNAVATEIGRADGFGFAKPLAGMRAYAMEPLVEQICRALVSDESRLMKNSAKLSQRLLNLEAV